MGTILRKLGEEYPVKLYQAALMTTALLLLVFAAVFGTYKYVSAERADREADKLERCVFSMRARDDLRVVILGIYDAIEADGENGLVQHLRSNLDRDAPKITLEGCLDPPPIVVVSTPPSTEGG